MDNLRYVITADGSKTLYNAQVGEHYHSKHGAHQESRHVFLQSGLEYFLNRTGKNEVSILEIGFGTGLNFLLSTAFCDESKINLNYTGIEAYPLSLELLSNTGYEAYVPQSTFEQLLTVYETALQQEVPVGNYSILNISNCLLEEFRSDKKVDVIYFDAFAAIHQPEMWTFEAISHCCSFLNAGGVFVTYAITGNLKRIMKSLNFTIEKAPGAPGKREMLRATKN